MKKRDASFQSEQLAMLLAIDAGNTSIHIGLFADAILQDSLKIPTRPLRTTLDYRAVIEAFLAKQAAEKPLRGVIISSVVSELQDVLNNAVRGLSAHEPWNVSAALDTGLRFVVERPYELGADRVANAVAARDIFGEPALVVDFGTATTLSVVKDDRFVGGAILPGIAPMADSLHRNTSKLPHVDVNLLTSRLPLVAIGKNTTKCIVSGIIYGTVGGVERLIAEMEREQGCTFKVVLTGGNSDLLSSFIQRDFFLEPDLTLHGLRLIFERNA
jgi:type III pantothenate kinase